MSADAPREATCATLAPVLDSFGLLVYALDAETRSLAWLGPTGEVLGSDLASTTSLDAWVTGHVLPDDRATYRATLEAALRDRREVELEYRVVRADGATIHVHDVCRVAKGDASGRRRLGLVTDVSARHAGEIALREAEREVRRALEEKSVLLREIHHRVKNNLQVVSSLLYLQGAAVDDASVRRLFEESRHRILSMAFIHETLYQSEDLSRVDFLAYVRKLVGGLAATYASLAPAAQIHTCVDDTKLDVDTAIPCGLIVNELVTNALKYAFPGGRPGRILVTFRVTEGRRILAVEDDGVGLPPGIDPRTLTTLGLKLVTMLAEQLHASIEIDAERGTRYRIVFGGEGEPAVPT